MKSLGHVRLFATCVGLHPTGLQGLYLPSFKAKEPGVRDRKISGLTQLSLTFLAPRTGFLEDHFSRAGDRGVVQVVMERWGGAGEEASLTLPLLTSCRAAWFLTVCRLVLAHSLGAGDPGLVDGRAYMSGARSWNTAPYASPCAAGCGRDTAAVLTSREKGRLPAVGELALGGLISYQGNLPLPRQEQSAAGARRK